MNSAICTSNRSFPLKPLAAAVLLMYAAGIQSAPEFVNSPGGNVTVTTPDATTTVVTQTGDRAVANWNSFSISEGETVRFDQLGGINSVILNRVTGEDISNIFGTLQANGRVFLINPNGIVFGANSQVSVNSLVASTLDFKRGFPRNNADIELELDGSAASIINNGQITANDILLIAPTITNNGTLNGVATENGLSGTVGLISAREVTVNTSGDNLAFTTLSGHEDALIEQLGTLMAEGGRVVLLARPASDSSPSVINIEGVNQAARISINGDTVRLSGNMNSGNGTGTLEVTADNIAQTAAVNVDNATLNASDSVALGDFNAAGTLTVNAENSITLDNLTANRVVLTAGNISQNADKTIAVADTTSLTARNITLDNTANSFEGQVTLDVEEQATLRSNADLAVQGDVGNATLNANNVVFDGLTTTGDLNATAVGSVSQLENSTLTVGDAATLNAANITLGNAGNNFSEPVNLNVTGDTNLRGTGRLEVTGSVDNATLEAQNLVISNLAVGGNLDLKADTINQTTDLVVQGTTRIENTGEVNLALSNDFVGNVTLAGSSSSNAAVNLTDRNNIDVGGQAGAVNITANQPGAGAVTLRNLRTQALAVTASTVSNADTDTFGGSVNVSGTTQLTADNVELNNDKNNFGGRVSLQVSGPAVLTAANNLNVSGNAADVTLNAESIEFEQALNVGISLSIEASRITQDAALTVVGSTSINNTESAILTNAGNDFASAVELRNVGDVELVDENDIEVFGNAGSLAVTTSSGTTTLGELTVGELTEGNLVVNADQIQQNARVVVSGESTLSARRVALNGFENDFVGKVTLGANERADLLDANSLRVAGSSGVTNLQAQTLIVDGLTTQGTATLIAEAIQQEGALITNGETSLKGGAVNLNTSSSNRFSGAVNVDLTGAANIRSSDNLVLSGTAETVNAAATNSLTVTTLNSQDITLSAGQVNLENFTAQGDLTLNGGTINQQGALTVEGTTTLGASNVLLGGQPNDFKDDVVLNNAGNVALQDANNIRVQGAANTLTLTAAGDVGQSGVLNVGSTSNITAANITAANITLNNDANRFGGEVAVQATGTATVSAANNLQVSGNASTLNATATGDVEFGATAVGALVANAGGQIKQVQSTAVVVNNAASMTADSVALNNSGNDFKDVLSLNVAGQATVTDQNNLQVQGNAQNLIATATNSTLTLGAQEDLNIGGGTLTASIIELDRLKVLSDAPLQDDTRLQANTITQTQASTTGGKLTLAAQTVDLTQTGNDFQGELLLEGVQTATIQDANQLSIGGAATTLNASAVESLTFTDLTAGTLTADAQQINQTTEAGNEVRVTGTTNLNGESVDLRNANNDFVGAVTLQVSGQAQLRDANTLTLQGEAGQLNASAQQINQLADSTLTVANTTELSANNVSLIESGNDFRGDVVLNNAGSVALQDANNIRVQGAANTLTLTAAGDVGQSGVLNVGSTSNITAANITLNNDANRFGGEVAVQATGTAIVNAANNLQISGNASTLNAIATGDVVFGNTTADTLTALTDNRIRQVNSTALVVNNAASMTADSVALNNSANDFKDVLSLNVAGQATVTDQNNLQVQGNAQNLIATATNSTLTLGAQEDLNIGSGTLTASTIELDQLNVSGNARLQANTITQTQASNTRGKLTLAAQTVDLTQTGNDFQGELLLEGVQTATIQDANQLSIGGAATTLNASAVESLTFTDLTAGTLTASAQQINQINTAGNEVRVTGTTNLSGESVDLRNANNDFVGAVNLQVSGQAQLRDANTLTLQGEAGLLNASAQQINQLADSTLTVANTTELSANNVSLIESGNDFQGDVVLNVSGNATVRDANTLSVAGQVNGATNLVAQSIEQTNALRTNSTLLLQANNVNLSNAENQLNGAVRLEDATQATLVSQGDLTVTGSNLGSVDFTAEEVMLNELGSIQQLTVAADEVKQGAALLVQGQTTLSANKVEFNNADNDFVGTVVVQAGSASNPDVQIRDRNSLAVQGENLALTAEVQGDLTVQANNLALGQTTVAGIANIDLTGALTQTSSVTLNDSQLSAGRIVLNNSANQFNGTTQLDSDQLIELRTAGDLTADTGSSSGALALNIGGNTNLQGENVELAQSQFGGNLTVNANQISQTNGAGAIDVEGNTQLAAVGGSIDLQNQNNQFNGDVSANAEQTSIATNGDLRLLSLVSRGGEITADGRLLLLGNIEQTGGTLTFTARGIPRPLSSAALAMMLPPSLDVFSNKEAVNPITGFGRLDVASAVIDQQAGQISTSAGATTVFNSSRNGSINLTQVNQINGRFAALSGPAYDQAFVYSPSRGTSLFAVNNDVRLRVSENGIEADLVAIRSRGLSTQGPNAVIHARMPYNDIAVGTSRSLPGLTLSIPLSNSTGTQGGAAPFGESANSGQSVGGGAIRVEVGDLSRAGLGGFLTVLPFEGSNLLPGQVVYLAGPERPGTQAFFYDGARSLDRIPVVYNGTLLLSPQENAALTTAQGAVVLARQEQTRSVVRTENVAGKVINGVVVEVGPGRPATEGEGGASKPASCDSSESELNCNP